MCVKAIITCLFSQACISSVLKPERKFETLVPRLCRIALRHATFAPQLQHQVEILAPAIGIATGHNHCRGLFDLGLVIARSPQTPLLLRRLHHDKAPGLHVVSTRRMQPRLKNLLQVVRRNRRAIETGRCSSLLNRLTQRLLDLWPSFSVYLFCYDVRSLPGAVMRHKKQEASSR